MEQSNREIYLDNSATTKISPEALKKYISVSEECYGNPSSLHTFGFHAEGIIKNVRKTLLSACALRQGEVIFTASGSEANNLAITGHALSKERYLRGAKIISTAGEHASVREPLSRLKKMGFKVVYLPTRGGVIDMELLKRELTPDVILVTLMAVNNETGAAYDIKAASAEIKRRAKDALLHVDATQSFMKLPTNMQSMGIDMLTVSSHKIHGPKGVGALVVSDNVIRTRGLSPIIYGGGQESGLRSGTENVPGIAAFGVAIEESAKDIAKTYEKLESLRSYLVEKLTREPSLAEISITNPERHAPHILNITLPNIKSETMLHFLSSMGIYVSSGSACSSNSAHISSALTAYGRTEQEADCSVRISFSRHNTEGDIDALCEGLSEGLARLARIKT